MAMNDRAANPPTDPRTRGGTPYAGLMRAAARELEDRDIDALARYYASLPRGCTARG